MISFQSIAKQLGNKEVLETLSKSVNASPEQIEKVAELGLPTLMEAMNRNSNDSQGAESLSKAVDQHKGADLSDIAGFLDGVDAEDGAKVLNHVLGDKTSKVEKSIAKKTGLSQDQIGDLLVKFGPLLLSYMGGQKEEEALDADGISGLTSTISGLFGGGNQSTGSSLLGLATSMLDNDDDDDDDDSGNMLGGLLNSLF